MTGALDLTVGIIGAGSMGGAIARGLVASGTLEAARVLVADFDAEKRAALSALGMRAFDGAEALLAEGPDVVVLAVKPQVLPGVMEQAAPHVRGRLAISIAAGVPLSALEDAMPGARVVRVMPNLPVQVRSGATALTAGSLATPEDVELARGLFSALGTVVGTAPAFFSLFVDELTRAAVLRGLPAADARPMVEATMRGCAEQLLNEGVHPREYMERVTSPGGTTAAALRELEPALAEGTFAAVDAALARTRELAGDR